MSRESSSPTSEWFLVALNGLEIDGSFEDLPSLLSFLRERLGGVELRERISQDDVEREGRRVVACRSRGGRTLLIVVTGGGELEVVGVARRVC